MGKTPRRFPAVFVGPRLHRKPDAAGIHTRQIRRLDRAAESRHRQQARRLRICETGVTRCLEVQPQDLVRGPRSLAPCPLVGEGWGGGGRVCPQIPALLISPPPCPSPARGEEAPTFPPVAWQLGGRRGD